MNPARSTPVAAPRAFAPSARRNRGRRAAVKVGHVRDLLGDLDLLRFSVCAWVVITLSGIQTYVGPLNSIRPALLLTALSLGLIFFKPGLVDVSMLRSSWTNRAVLAFLGVGLGSAIFGLSMGSTGVFFLNNWSKNLIFFFIMVVAIRNPRDLLMMMWAFVISSGILAFLALTVMDVNVTSAGLGRLVGGQQGFDANDLGMLFLMALPLAILVTYSSSSVGKTAAWLVIVAIPAVIALTGSRGAFLGIVVTGPVLFFALSRISLARRLGAVIVLAGSLLLAAPSGYWEQMRTIVAPEDDYNVSDDYGRMALFKRGMGYMSRYPVFGVGISNFARAEGTISPIARARASQGLAVRWIAPHNTYAQVGAETGVLGLGIWLSLLFGGSIGLWRLRGRIPKAWEFQTPERKFLRDACLFLPVSFVAFASTSFFLSHAYTPPGYIIFAIAGGLVVVVKRELAKDRRAYALQRLRVGPPQPFKPAVKRVGA